MADAQSLNATFFALSKRENGGVLLGASIAYAISLILLVIIIGAAAWFALGGGAFFSWYSDMMAATASGQTPQTSPPNLGGMFLMIPIYFIYMILVFVLLAAFESACHRWMVRGERSGPLFLHFGADMWRVYATYWLWLLYWSVALIGLFVVSAIAGVIGANAGAAGGWIGLVLGLGYFLAGVYVTVRLSPAAATSVGIGKFAPFKAWSATSGRFWALFGAFVLISLIYFVAYIVIVSVSAGAFYSQIFSGMDWSAAQTNPEAFSAAYEQSVMQAMQGIFGNPTTLALMAGGQVLLFVAIVFFYLLYFGVASRAVQAALEEGKIEQEAAA